MKNKSIFIMLLAVAILFVVSCKDSSNPVGSTDSPVLAGAKKGGCTTIQGGTLLTTDGQVVEPGYDKWGYNYQAHMFNGGYCEAYRNAAWCQQYSDVRLIMKWNDAWLSNTDCDGDGKLDRHFGFPSYIGSGAWETNHQSGEYEVNGEVFTWNYFVKIVAAPFDANKVNGMWYAADGTEIGPEIWGEFAIIQEVYNDQGTGEHGIAYLSPVGPGLGKFKQ